MHLGPLHVVGMLATIGLTLELAYIPGRKVASAAVFQRRREGRGLDCLRAIMGTWSAARPPSARAISWRFPLECPRWFTLGSGFGV